MVGRVVLNAPQGVGRRRPGDRLPCQERRAMKKEKESGPPMKFEEKMDKLDKIVKSMERGDMPLDEMIKAFEEGRRLLEESEKELESIRLKIEKVTADGKVEALDFDN